MASMTRASRLLLAADKTADAYINSLPVCNLSENLSAAKSNRDALVIEATYFLATAEGLSADEWNELSDLIAAAAAANTTSEIEKTTAALQQAFSRMRGY